MAIGLATIALISVVGIWLFHRAGSAEAIRDAKDRTRIAAEIGGAGSTATACCKRKARAIAAVDRVVQKPWVFSRIRTTPMAASSIWDSTGRIVYSDEPALIGKRYPFGSEEQ